MLKNPIKLSATLLGMALVAFTSCEDQDFTDVNNDATRVEVNTISAEMAKVRDYVPDYAVMAHRGSTFWAPEETESAWRWAREMGADYLESDLQCTKDGVILANHDDNLKRTTNIENVYSELVPATRKAFYMRHGMRQKLKSLLQPIKPVFVLTMQCPICMRNYLLLMPVVGLTKQALNRLVSLFPNNISISRLLKTKSVMLKGKCWHVMPTVSVYTPLPVLGIRINPVIV